MDTRSGPGLPAILNRIVGLALILVFLLGYEPSGSGFGNSLLLPLALALGSWMILRSVLALALAAALLAGAHSSPGADEMSSGLVYPIIAFGAALTVLTSLGHRFRRHILATRAARRARRGD
jgi:hypothetical protein